MKKITYIIIATLFLAGTGLVHAETSSTTPRKTFLENRAEIRTEAAQNIKDSRVEARASIRLTASTTREANQEERAEAKIKIEEQRKLMVRNIFENQLKRVSSRLDATITRLENVSVRIGTRIEKIKNAGGNTASAEVYLSQGKSSLVSARVELAKLKVLGDASLNNVSSTTPQTSDLKNLKASAKNVEKLLQDARKSLEKAVGSLKGVSTTINASSTSTIN